MKFFLVKDSSNFAWSCLKNNLDGWFMLSLKSFLMMLVMIGGLMTFMLCTLFLYGFMGITPGFFLYDPSIFIQLLILLFFIAGIYQALVQIVSYSNVPIANSLDAAYQKPLRGFNNRVQVRALFFVGIFQSIVIGLGFLMLIVPGIYFAVRFSFARLIILDEQCGSMSAMKKSWELTENNFSNLFPVSVCTFVLLMFPITRLINLFFPFIDLMMSYVYVSLRQK
ncbi:MAG: YciC family protein [Candidatus Dependentiae bacterium]|nr:YciC family protein [Candidatus Dependentiae bacterium]